MLAVLFVGCKPTVPPNPPPLPHKVESAVGDIQNVSKNVDGAILLADRMKDNVGETGSILSRQNLTIEDNVNNLEKLRQKVVASQKVQEAEVVHVKNGLLLVGENNKNIQVKNDGLQKQLAEQRSVLERTKGDVSKSYVKMIEKEREANELRTQAEFLHNLLKSKDTEKEKLKAELEKEKVKSAKASVYRNWIFGIVGAFVLWIVVKNVLMIYFPLTRFRI
jgi:hypothetical protein